MCGAVRYEIAEPFVASLYCHCTRCQRRTGTAASASGRTAPNSLRVVRGEELVRTWWPPQGWGKAFCAECGSALWSQNPDDLEVLSVRLGTCDGDPGITPAYRQFVDYAAVWEPIPDDGLPRYPEGRPTSAQSASTT
jgi:hypothetical protein